MKWCLSIACATLLQALVFAQSEAPRPVPQRPPGPVLPAGDVSANEIAAFVDALPKDVVSDKPIKSFDAGSHRVTVSGVFRPKSLPGDAILHETRTSETYYVLQGTGTVVTGGVLADRIAPPATATSQDQRAKRIDGGISRIVGPGDIVVIPGWTPHWWSSLDTDIRYIIIRTAPNDSPGAKE